jgi:hypothetical protein
VRAVNPSLLLLILVWVAILLPGALRSRLRPSPRASVGGFQRTMDGLKVQQRVVSTHVPASAPAHTRSATPTAGAQEHPLVVRRRRRTLRLFTTTAVSLAAAPVLGGAAWLLAALLTTTSLVAVVVLRRLKLQRDAARSVLVSLDLRRPAQPLIDELTGELVLAAGSSASVVRLPSWRG